MFLEWKVLFCEHSFITGERALMNLVWTRTALGFFALTATSAQESRLKVTPVRTVFRISTASRSTATVGERWSFSCRIFWAPKMKAPRVFRKERIPAITAPQWVRIAEVLAEPDRGFMPHDIGNRCTLSYTLAHALIIGLASDGLAKNEWLIYHGCSEAPVGTRRFEDGFQEVPWVCPECQEEILDVKELSYDLRCIPKGPIEFR